MGTTVRRVVDWQANSGHQPSGGTSMSFCEHCEGQRFGRAQVLRILRATRQDVRKQSRACSADDALAVAIKAVRALEIPHLEPLDELSDEPIVH